MQAIKCKVMPVTLILLLTIMLAFNIQEVKADWWSAPVQLTDNTATEGFPSISGDGGKIAFESDVDGDFEIFVVNSDGTGLQQLTFNTEFDGAASISDSGGKIAFESHVYGPEIFLVNSDGSELKQLTSNTWIDGAASISGDGSKIAFHSGTVTGDPFPEIFVKKFEFHLELLIQLTNNTLFDMDPSISGDGGKIAFESDVDGDFEIFVVNSDGSELKQLTFNTAGDWFPSISGDGGKIAFESDVDGDFEIFVVNSDGTGLQQLTFNTANDRFPSISGDGSKIAFHSNVDGDSEIFVVNSDGTGLQQLTFNTAHDKYPSISGDGGKIAFESDMDGDVEIWVIGSQVQLDVEVVGSGTTKPAPGNYTYDEGTVVDFRAIPDSGWLLDCWLIDGVDVGAPDPCTVTMDTNRVLSAVFVEMDQAASFPLWVFVPVIGGIIGVIAVLVYLRKRKPKKKIMKPTEEIPPLKVKELSKLNAKCADTIDVLNSYIENPNLTNDGKAWNAFRELIAITEQCEGEFAQLIEIRNAIAILRRNRDEDRRVGRDELADEAESAIQNNYVESIRIIRKFQEKLP